MNMLLVFNVTFDIFLVRKIVTTEHIGGVGPKRVVLVHALQKQENISAMEAQHKREMCLIGN